MKICLKCKINFIRNSKARTSRERNPENPNNFEFLTGLQAPEEEFKDNALKKSNEFPIQEQPLIPGKKY